MELNPWPPKPVILWQCWEGQKRLGARRCSLYCVPMFLIGGMHLDALQLVHFKVAYRLALPGKVSISFTRQTTNSQVLLIPV